MAIPADANNAEKADQIKEKELVAGYTSPNSFTFNEQCGMVFTAPVTGPKTSKNTTYTRSELREMLRNIDTDISLLGVNNNNRVFSSIARSEQEKAGGIDGTQEATLTVDLVNTTGIN